MKQYSWVAAIKKVMEDSNGVASLQMLYENIGKYRDYSHYKNDSDWQAALRGHLYREIKNNRNFRRIGLAIYALQDYREEAKPKKEEKERMHSYMQGICLELGNFEGYDTYTADPSSVFRENILLGDLATLKEIPPFTYEKILEDCKRIDALWFNKKGFAFPKRAFEVVHSVGTLTEAFTRMFQIREFMVNFFIIGSQEIRRRFDVKSGRDPYSAVKEQYHFLNYDQIIEFYDVAVKHGQLKRELFI